MLDPAPVAAAVRSVSPAATTGLLVWDRVTGQAIASEAADRQFQSASLVKLLIAIDTLSGGTGPDPDLERRLVRMLQVSADGEASRLWDRQGGAELVGRTARLLGLGGAAPPDVPGQWGNTLLTAADLLSVYRHLLDSPGTGQLVLAAMRAAPRVAADGFDQHFGIPTAFAGQPWAVKQGWGSSGRGVFVHTSGVVGAGDRYVVVLLTEHPRGTGFGRAAAAVSAGAAALAAQLGPRPLG